MVGECQTQKPVNFMTRSQLDNLHHGQAVDVLRFLQLLYLICKQQQLDNHLRRLVENLQNLTPLYHILVQVRPLQRKSKERLKSQKG